MARAFLGLLLASLLLPALPASSQPAGYTIPTQADFQVGGLNVSTWVMRDTRAVAFTPGLQQNPLTYLWNLNFTAGSLGVFYVKASMREPDAYEFRARLSSTSPVVQVVEAESNRTSLVPRPCEPEGGSVRCWLDAQNTSADYAFQFFIASSAEPGQVPVTVHAEAYRNSTGQPVLEAKREHSYNLTIIDPVPPFATRSQTGNTTVYAWVNGGPTGYGGAGCLGGSAVVPDTNVSQAGSGVLCVLAISRSPQQVRVVATFAGAPWMGIPTPTWTSEPFNASSGGTEAPVTSLPFTVGTDAPLGGAEASVSYRLERPEGGGWVPAGEGEMVVPFTVTPPAVLVVPKAQGIRWLAQAPILAATVGGLGYLAYKNRKPRLEPRSQALRELQKGKPRDEGGTSQAEAQRQEAHAASWAKKRQVLEAKREDVLKSIRLAEERLQRGEITDHVLQGIRERKERQLEQIEKEMEELR